MENANIELLKTAKEDNNTVTDVLIFRSLGFIMIILTFTVNIRILI